ncbi:MAG: hypothetical protein R3D25_02355 [Geminicoccaceae bacterium]
MHRTAARLDDRFEVVAGVLSSDAERSRAQGVAIGLAPERAYAELANDARTGRARPDGIDVVAVMTPNHLHFPVASWRSMPASTWSATSPWR